MIPKQVKRFLIIIAAVVFLLLGIAGLALPFLQGFLFLAMGLLLLSISFPRVRIWLSDRTVKYPRFHNVIAKTDIFFRRILGEE